MQSNYLGGVKALDWRKRVAMSSKDFSDNVQNNRVRDRDAHNRTFKFPLEITQDLSRILPEAEKLYEIIEGTNKSSLAALVFAVHLSGFRLFGNERETKTFEEREKFPDEHFLKVANKTFGNIATNLRPSEIYSALKKKPRTDNAKWDVDHILRKLQKDLAIKDTKDNEPLNHVFTKVAETIRIEYKDEEWGGVQENPRMALKSFVHEFQEIDPDFPDFSQINIKDIEPDNRTFACDPEMSFHDMETEPSEHWAHHSVSVIVQSLLRDGEDPQNLTAKKIQTRFITLSQNGLSWLFGNGLIWLQNTSAKEIAEKLGIPDDEGQRVSQLQTFARALPCQDSLWLEDGFGKFRKRVGGKLDSWVNNYWQRLDGLQKYFDSPSPIKISPNLLEEDHRNLFSGSNMSGSDLKHAVNIVLPKKIDKAKKSVQALRGGAEYEEADIRIVEEATEYLISLIGEIEILNNRIEQKIDSEEISSMKQPWERLKIKIEGIKKPERLNRIGGGTTKADEVIKEIEISLGKLIEARRMHYKDLMTHAKESGNTDPLPNLISLERKKLEDSGKPITGEENARRWLLHQFAILANRMSEETREELIGMVKLAFPEKDGKGRKNRDANKFFYNRKGAIYVSPFSRRRHEPFTLKPTALTRDQDWLAKAESLLDTVKEKLSHSGTPNLLKDILTLEGYIFAMRLRCLPELIPAGSGKYALVAHEKEMIFIPSVLREQFTSANVSRDAVLKLFNLYTSAINGLQFRATRSGFITRVVFSRTDTDKLVYVPKNEEWTPPKPYFKGQSPVARALQKDWIIWKEKDHIVDVEKTFIELCKTKEAIGTKEASAYLAQAPHDWWLKLDIEGIGEERRGVTVATSSAGTFINKGKKHTGLVRLRGPSSRRTVLDRTLWMKTRNNDLQLGDPNLIMDTQYSQKTELKNELPCIKVEQGTTKMEAAILLVDKAASNKPFDDMYDRIVAIDQGERGIGYAVFDLQECIGTGQFKPMTDPENGKPITGTVSAPSIRALIRAVRNHRGRRQPQQKVNMTYSTLLQQRRENVVGDVCNRIDTLCEKYRGFPVLESAVSNLESGGKQLQLVYNSVSKMYLYDNKSEARNIKRQHRWGRAKQWRHPWLVKLKYDRQQKVWTKEQDGPYVLYPGASVAPAATSQTCHKCGRNPIREMKEDPNPHINVEDDGLIKLADGKIRLCEGSKIPQGEENKIWEKRIRRRNERLPLNRPIKARTAKKDELLKLLRRNLRQPPKSLQSPDTTQSRYHCVYIDCDFTGHADENAAINIGIKFLKERVHIKNSRKNLKPRSK